MFQRELIELGLRVKEIREKRGLSVNELAKHSGIGRGQLYKLESGQANPTFTMLCRLALALQCDLATLVAVVPNSVILYSK